MVATPEGSSKFYYWIVKNFPFLIGDSVLLANLVIMNINILNF